MDQCGCRLAVGMVPLVIAVVFNLVLGLRGAKHVEDVSSSVEESQWFHASSRLEEIDGYCRLWHGGTHLECLDLYSCSWKVAKTFLKHGRRAYAFDIQTKPDEDILSENGFYQALNLALMFLCAQF